MDVFVIKKGLNEFADQKLKEFYDFYSNPNNNIWNRKATDWVQFKTQQGNIEFELLGWDFVITKEINTFSNSCILKTNRLVLDENDYPKRKMVHFPDMDIKITLPHASQESFRFVKDMIVQQNYGKADDGEGSPVNRTW